MKRRVDELYPLRRDRISNCRFLLAEGHVHRSLWAPPQVFLMLNNQNRSVFANIELACEPLCRYTPILPQQEVDIQSHCRYISRQKRQVCL